MHREWHKAASCVQTGILNACREEGEMPGLQTIPWLHRNIWEQNIFKHIYKHQKQDRNKMF